MGIGEQFQRDTSYAAPEDFSRPALEPVGPGAGPVELPDIRGEGAGLWKVLAARRSGRGYAAEPPTLEELGALCWAAQGVTAVRGGHKLRAAPSAGALYALDLYAVLPGPEPAAGVYVYGPDGHQLKPVLRGAAMKALAAAAAGQKFMARSAVIFVLTAHPERSVWRYEERSWRYFYLDAGHIGENIMLAAEALGLASCGIGAFYDSAVNEVLVLDGASETAVYMVAVGRPRGGRP